MSAKSLPVAARLSRRDLRMLQRSREGGGVVLEWNRPDQKTAARVVGGGFATLARIASHSAKVVLTDAGRDALKLHGR